MLVGRTLSKSLHYNQRSVFSTEKAAKAKRASVMAEWQSAEENLGHLI